MEGGVALNMTDRHTFAALVSKRVSGVPGTTTDGFGFVVICRTSESGGTRIRTGDTMIFSHVLYQLSYPAGS
jgi:hypothetical protein